MQKILSIDVTVDPACAVITEVDGRNVKVVETHRLSLDGLFSAERLRALAAEQTFTASQTPAGGSPVDAAAPPEAAVPAPSKFGELLAQVTTPWTAAVMIVPPYEYLSLNAELPFDDAKSINKILDLEVQDVVPFDIGEFHLQHRRVAAGSGAGHDIHVSLIPRSYMRAIMRICRESGFEPYVICPPASALGAIYYLASSYLQPNSALVACTEHHVSVCAAIDGQIRTDRMARRALLAPDEAKSALLADLKLTLSAIEQRYHVTLESIYLMGNPLTATELQQTLGRNVEPLNAAELVRDGTEDSGLAAIASVFAQDFDAPPALTNFRAREFAYRPQLRELKLGLRSLAPFAGTLLLVALFSLGGVYLMRERYIRRLQGAMQVELERAVPELKGKGGDVTQIVDLTRSLDAELKGLGSASATPPLEALLWISYDISKVTKKIPALQVSSLSISSDTMKIVVDAPDYSALEKIDKMLKKRHKVFCNVQQSNRAHASMGRGSEFTLTLCK